MTEYRVEIRDAVLAYLQTEFPESEIQEELDKESYCFRLMAPSDTHFIRVMYSAMHTNNADDIASQLDQYAVASTMRSLGDFPVVVTEQGCMFGSP